MTADQTSYLYTTSKKHGLIVQIGTEKTRVSDYIKILGDAQEEGGKKLLIVLSIKDQRGALQRFIVRRGILGSAARVFEELLDRGYRLPEEKALKDHLMRFLRLTIPNRRYAIVARTGWTGDAYALSNGRILRGPSKPRVIYEPEQLAPQITSVIGGGLKAWREGVALPALHSRRMMFVISVSLSALLLERLMGESTTLHFFSKHSSRGKTLLELVGLSVHGPASREDLKHWNATMVMLDELAAEHCDRVLVLDDTGHISANPEAAAVVAQKVAFKITAGQGRLRSRFFGKGGNLCRWRVLVLSSGEEGISEIASAGGRRRLKGAQLRMIDIPAVASPKFGVFDSVPKATTSGQLAEQIEESCRANFGHPARVFIKRVLADPPRAKRRGRNWMARFLKKASVSTDGWEQRFAATFARAYAAGRMAIEWGILPWTARALFRAVLTVYREARSAIPDSSRTLEQALESVRRRLKSPKRLYDLRHGSTPERGLSVETAEGFIKEDERHGVYFAVKAKALRRWIGEGTDLGYFGQHLRRLGHLVIAGMAMSGANPVPTKQVKIKGIGRKRRYYCIKESFLRR